MQHWHELKLDNFSGPLDLLLHMIKEKQMDIMDVNLLEISNQYIAYITECDQLDVEIASEYLTMAAYLIELKSRLLIPKEEVQIDSDYESQQRDDLIRRLVEYHKIKEVTQYFKDKQLEFLKTFSKPKSIVKITKIDDDTLPLAPNNINIDKFANVFLKIIEKNNLKKPVINTLTTKEVSPEEVANDIRELFKDKTKVIWTLDEILRKKEYTIQMLVATFLAILDLTRQQIIFINQLDDDIEIKINLEMVGS